MSDAGGVPTPGVSKTCTTAGAVCQNSHGGPAKCHYFAPERDSDSRLLIFLIEI
jgi:hypothetical protein